MAYADLTTEQKASLNSWMGLFRASCGEIARVNNHLDAVNVDYNGAVGTILGLLENTDVIPNASGLDGAEPMTKAQVITCVSYMQGILGYNTAAHRGNLALGCGETNLIG